MALFPEPNTLRPEEWPTSPPHIKLAPTDVHVWRFRLDVGQEELYFLRGLLSPDERIRVNRLRFNQDRRRSIAARGCLRQILATVLGQPPSEIRISVSGTGKPTLHRPGGLKIQFNLSHSNTLGVCAITLLPQIGIDVEEIGDRVDYLELASRFFTASEKTALLALPALRRRDAFFCCWARKEAFLKAVGVGSLCNLSDFEVTVDPEAEPRLVEDRTGYGTRPWSLRDLLPKHGYRAALAVSARAINLCRWAWP